MILKKVLVSASIALMSICFDFNVSASDSVISENDLTTSNAENKVDRIPKIHGVFRGRYEGVWPDYSHHFQVRNARVLLEGYLLRNLDYYFRVDLSDRGTIRFLDAWGRWTFNKEFNLQFGQFRVPFGVDPFRGAGFNIFADRSFIGKQMANVVRVGLQLSYSCQSLPITVQAGLFNSSTEQTDWHKGLDYVAKVSYRLSDITFTASFLSMSPAGHRMNIVDGTIGWEYENLIVEGTYQHLHYCNNAWTDVNAWLAFASYGIPVKWKPFDMLSFHGRFDAMDNHSNGIPDENGLLTANDPARRRLTAGSTLACNIKKVKAEITLDYEKYFYNKGVSAPVGEDNKIVAELVIKF